MELGLSLGESPNQKGSTKRRQGQDTKFRNIGLSLPTNHQEQEKHSTSDHCNVSTSDDDTTQSNMDSSSPLEPPSIQLDLLPPTPVPRNSFCEDLSRLEVVEEKSDYDKKLCVYNINNNSYEKENNNTNYKNNNSNILGLISEDEEDNNNNNNNNNNNTNNEKSKKRKKLRLSKDQSAFLEQNFKEHHTLSSAQKFALAQNLNLNPRQVEVWFQNRRARTKLKQTEMDCEYLKRCCEALREENKRLQKEVQDLKALKITSTGSSSKSPFYTPPPPTTLVMCPSCEKVAEAAAAATINTNSDFNHNASVTLGVTPISFNTSLSLDSPAHSFLKER